MVAVTALQSSGGVGGFSSDTAIACYQTDSLTGPVKCNLLTYASDGYGFVTSAGEALEVSPNGIGAWGAGSSLPAQQGHALARLSDDEAIYCFKDANPALGANVNRTMCYRLTASGTSLAKTGAGAILTLTTGQNYWVTSIDAAAFDQDYVLACYAVLIPSPLSSAVACARLDATNKAALVSPADSGVPINSSYVTVSNVDGSVYQAVTVSAKDANSALVCWERIFSQTTGIVECNTVIVDVTQPSQLGLALGTPFELATRDARFPSIRLMHGTEFLACYSDTYQSRYVSCHVLDVNHADGTITRVPGGSLLFDSEVGEAFGTGKGVLESTLLVSHLGVAGTGQDNGVVCYVEDANEYLQCNHVRLCEAWHGEQQLGKSVSVVNEVRSASIAMSSLDADRTWVCFTDVARSDTRCLVLSLHSASAGDDPIFVGADGVPYEVRGEPWKYFNLISSPQLSLNAQFLPVPAEYVGASGRLSQFSDTVLGTLHLAACIPGTPRAVGVLFDVFDGAMHCTVGGARAFEGDMEAVRETVPCEWALEASGLSAELEVAACAMSTMSCGYTKAGELEPLRARDASVVRVSTARLNVTHYGGARLSVMRDVIDRPEPQSEVDCAPLARWDRAGRACRMWNAVSRGEQPSAAWHALPVEERVAVLAHLTAGNASRQLHFHHVNVRALPHRQGQVHGLLGQRAISPKPIPRLPEERQQQQPEPSELAARASGTLSAAMGEGAGGAGVGTTLRVAVEADGRHQGEGAIAGSYKDYQVPYVSRHSFVHSRFRCAAAETR